MCDNGPVTGHNAGRSPTVEKAAREARRSIRLPDFDYRTPAGYFVTICTAGRRTLFGSVVDGCMRTSRFGEIVRDEWFRTARIRPGVLLLEEEFVVMPNHVHGIIWLTEEPSPAPNPSGSGRPRLMPRSVGAIVGAFKSAVARRINQERGSPGAAVWQRNYWERIIRSDRELERIRTYIAENPLRWHEDSFYPDRAHTGEMLDFLAMPGPTAP